MATWDHSPYSAVRGYKTGMMYWHHDNDYWSMSYQLRCNGSSMTDLWHAPPGNPTAQGPALGFNNTCVGMNPPGGEPAGAW
jgi:hypothetical protein